MLNRVRPCCLDSLPLWLSQISRQWRRRAPPALGTLILAFFIAHAIHVLRPGSQILRPRSCKVRSSGHVKWPHVGKSLIARLSFTDWTIAFNPAAAGPPRHPPAAGGGAYSCPLYFCDDIVATRRDREAKFCRRLPEYLAEVVSKFGVNLIWNYVAVTSEVKL